MTVAAIEAAPAAVEAAPARATVLSRSDRPLPSPRRRTQRTYNTRTRRAARPASAASTARASAAGSALGSSVGSRPRGRSRGRGGRSSGNYQGVILAEFVGAIVLVALTPIAANQKQQTQTGGLSPYAGQDMIKLAAITVTYLILALVSVRPGPGRFAAWFGGLILLAIGLNEAAHLAQVFDIFGGVKDTASSAASKAASGVTQVGNTIAGRG